MFKKEITPLSDSMIDAISQSINTLQHVEPEPTPEPEVEAPAPEAPEEVSESVELAEEKMVCKDCGDEFGKPTTDCKHDCNDPEGSHWMKSEGYGKKKMKEEAELEENMVASLAKDFESRLKKQGYSSRTQERERMATLAMAKKKGASALDMKNLDKAMNDIVNKLDESSCGSMNASYKPKAKKEEMDPVNPKAVKKKFDDRKDKDIDNDGDVDDSDEYLHKRRKAISKALEKKPNASVNESAEVQGLDENMSRAAKELEAYARKNGGIDKMDFMKAAMMMKKGQTNQLKKFVDDLDTEPREKILHLMQKDADRRKEYKAAQKAMRKEEVELDEAKSDYTINHKTFSSAVQHAVDVVKKRGFEVDEDDYSRKVTMGPRKPGKGKTNRYTIDLTKGGKAVKQKLQMQVYYDEGRYELNMYIS